jgi:serine/threonine protein kinase
MMGAKYNYKADLWSLGILICELVGGVTPFSAKMSPEEPELSPMAMVEMVNNGNM